MSQLNIGGGVRGLHHLGRFTLEKAREVLKNEVVAMSATACRDADRP
jgi:hypothetical protein